MTSGESDQPDAEFQTKLLATFKAEAREHVTALASGLLELERTAATERQAEVVERIFREAHSLKGAARAVNLTEIEEICQGLENVFAALKRGQIAVAPASLDGPHQALAAIESRLEVVEGVAAAVPTPRVADITASLNAALRSAATPPTPVAPTTAAEPSVIAQPLPARPSITEKLVTSDTVRVPAARLDAVLVQAEEMLSGKLAAAQRTADVRQLLATGATWNKQWRKLRPIVRMVQQSVERNGLGKATPHVTQLLEFLEWNRTFRDSQETELAALAKSADQDQRALAGMVDTLVDDTKRMLMLPFSSLFDSFPRFIRELSREQGKEVDLVIRGGDTEIDRRILEEMKDAFIHLVRNGIDHGIEQPAQRAATKKPPRGVITLAIAQRADSKVEILVADDGAGVDGEKVRSAAVRLGLLAPEAALRLSEHETLALIFESGLSTSPIITAISGRGLGLAIVREKVDTLGGTVTVDTHPGCGTAVRVVLPLTVATFRGVIVRVDDRCFVLPTANVQQVMRVDHAAIHPVENRETIALNGQAASLVWLADVLELPRRSAARAAAAPLPVVVLAAADKRIGFIVDAVVSDQEVLLRGLGKQLARVRNVAGATVLGTGQVVPVLHVPDLLASAVRGRAAGIKPAAVPVLAAAAQRRAVLVVEDSITARTLLKNVLEVAGYDVATAVDGIDAFTQLRTAEFDAVVSDVDMPRMNGFDLTAKVRGDPKLAELPIVLVTALESRDDRERGIEVGANAYIVKSNFDQSDLLEVLQRVI
jgi:two-component system chemotaxis sensor kinase CheA